MVCGILWTRYWGSGSDSDSSCQKFSFSDVNSGMEVRRRSRADTRRRLPPPEGAGSQSMTVVRAHTSKGKEVVYAIKSMREARPRCL